MSPDIVEFFVMIVQNAPGLEGLDGSQECLMERLRVEIRSSPLKGRGTLGSNDRVT
jgi:hypothetical protein